LAASPDPVAGVKGWSSPGSGGGEERKGRERGRGRRGREKKRDSRSKGRM